MYIILAEQCTEYTGQNGSKYKLRIIMVKVKMERCCKENKQVVRK